MTRRRLGVRGEGERVAPPPRTVTLALHLKTGTCGWKVKRLKRIKLLSSIQFYGHFYTGRRSYTLIIIVQQHRIVV